MTKIPSYRHMLTKALILIFDEATMAEIDSTVRTKREI